MKPVTVLIEITVEAGISVLSDDMNMKDPDKTISTARSMLN